MASYKVEICLKKKNPSRAQIFRYFRIESRNNEASLLILFTQYETLNTPSVLYIGVEG